MRERVGIGGTFPDPVMATSRWVQWQDDWVGDAGDVGSWPGRRNRWRQGGRCERRNTREAVATASDPPVSRGRPSSPGSGELLPRSPHRPSFLPSPSPHLPVSFRPASHDPAFVVVSGGPPLAPSGGKSLRRAPRGGGVALGVFSLWSSPPAAPAAR